MILEICDALAESIRRGVPYESNWLDEDTTVRRPLLLRAMFDVLAEMSERRLAAAAISHPALALRAGLDC
jgi:hypothetical protein